MKVYRTVFLFLAAYAGICPVLNAQSSGPDERQSILGTTVFANPEIRSPAVRVTGTPGSFRIIDRACPVLPVTDAQQRIVDTAVQEWARFGYLVDDQRIEANTLVFQNSRPRWRLSLYPEEVQQVAASVAGYWAAAPDSNWILNRQNEIWQQEDGLSRRWRDPWSAAFISWVMCESGLGNEQFKRAVAHHSYIDQAIMAAEAQDKNVAYHAIEPGMAQIVPGDMLCSSLRPVYDNLAERRAQLGEGARTHCDIVVRVNTQTAEILTIGGNVRASVRMKIFPGENDKQSGLLKAAETRRIIFVHLKLQGSDAGTDNLLHSPALQHLACTRPELPGTFTAAGLALPSNPVC